MRRGTFARQLWAPIAVAVTTLGAVWLVRAAPGVAPPAERAAPVRPPPDTRAAPVRPPPDARVAPPSPAEPALSLLPIPTAPAHDDVTALGPAAGASAQIPRPTGPVVVAALGDSLTDARSHGGGYLAPITGRCPRSRVKNFGKGADMVNQMRKRFLRDILPDPTPYTHLVVFGGVNDLYSDQTAGRSPEKVARDLLDVYTRAHARGMAVVAITVAPWGGFKRYFNDKRAADTRRLNDWIRDQFAAGTVDYVVDAYALLSCGNPDFLCRDYSIDGIHFNAKGHAVLGEALFDRAFAGCR